MLAPLLLLPSLCFTSEQPGMRTQRPRIYKQPGTGTQVPCRFCVGCSLFGYCLVSVNSQGRNPSTRRGSGPRSRLPSLPGYSLRVSGVMERWRPYITRG